MLAALALTVPCPSRRRLLGPGTVIHMYTKNRFWGFADFCMLEGQKIPRGKVLAAINAIWRQVTLGGDGDVSYGTGYELCFVHPKRAWKYDFFHFNSSGT